MSAVIYDTSAPRKPANLTVNADLLRKAKEAGVNLSQTLEEALALKLKAQWAERWREENAQAIAEYDRYVSEHGVFSDGLRRF